MGLDITAYSHLEFIGECEYRDEDDWDSHYEEGHVLAIAPACFPRSFAGLEGADKTTTYGHGSYEFVGGLCYRKTPQSDEFGFRAGSYSGYSMYRDALSQCFLDMGRDQFSDYWDRISDLPGDTPFIELINFSDCEGTIGPIAAQKLYQDHIQHRDKFVDGQDEYYIAKYNDWTHAFDLARRDGLVWFH